MAPTIQVKVPSDDALFPDQDGLQRRGGDGSRSPGGSPHRHWRGWHVPRGNRMAPVYKRPKPRGECTCTGTCYPGLPRPTLVWKVMAAVTGCLLFIQMVSCGMFFCVGVPFLHRFHEFRPVAAHLAATAAPGQRTQQELSVSTHAHTATLIPRVIHLTGRKYIPKAAQELVSSWQRLNGDAWEVRFYDDAACQSFVHKEFPEYWEAYNSLPKDVERADFFRYMVISRMGGVYADLDVECRQPLDAIILPSDTLLVGWEQEAPASAAARATPAVAGPAALPPDPAKQQVPPVTPRQPPLARTRQILNWFFAAAPRHPVLREMCDHIARNAMSSFSSNEVRDTMERTGLGVWTDVVLKYAMQHPEDQLRDPWKVRILPRVAFATRLELPPAALPPPEGAATEAAAARASSPLLLAALPPGSRAAVVVHHWLGSWQHLVPGAGLLSWLLGPLWNMVARPPSPEPLPPPKDPHYPQYPVSITGLPGVPPFTLMTHLVGSGDRQGGADVSATLTTWGAWQPGLNPLRAPSVVQALVGPLAPDWSTSAAFPGSSSGSSGGALTGAGSSGSSGWGRAGNSNNVLVDVGAGYGLASLAAAAKGHRVLAVETSARSLAALQASIEYNGLGGLVEIEQKILGAAEGWVCLQPLPQGAAAAAGTQGSSSSSGQQTGSGAGAAGAASQHPQQQQGAEGATPARRLAASAVAGALQQSGSMGVTPAAAAVAPDLSGSSGRAALRLAAELATSLWATNTEVKHDLNTLELEAGVRLRRGYPHWSDLHLATAAEGQQTGQPAAAVAAAAGGGTKPGGAASSDIRDSSSEAGRLGPAAVAAGDSSMPVNVAATDNSSSSTRAASTKSSSSSSGGGLEGVMSAATAAGGIIQRPPGSPGLPAGYYSTRAAAGRCSDLRPVTTLTSLLGNHTRVGALRISAHGHEGWVVAGALPYLKAVHRPEVIALDYWPAAMRAAGYTNPEHLLWQLYQLGYKDAAHAGRACEQRWADLTRALHWQPPTSAAGAAPLEPSWCKLQPEHYHMLDQDGPTEAPETLVFALRRHPPAHMPTSSSSEGLGQLMGQPRQQQQQQQQQRRAAVLDGNIFLKPKLATPAEFADREAAEVALVAAAAAAEAAARKWEDDEQKEMEEEGLVVRHWRPAAAATGAGAQQQAGGLESRLKQQQQQQQRHREGELHLGQEGMAMLRMVLPGERRSQRQGA